MQLIVSVVKMRIVYIFSVNANTLNWAPKPKNSFFFYLYISFHFSFSASPKVFLVMLPFIIYYSHRIIVVIDIVVWRFFFQFLILCSLRLPMNIQVKHFIYAHLLIGSTVQLNFSCRFILACECHEQFVWPSSNIISAIRATQT